jgi:hypothetical protein
MSSYLRYLGFGFLHFTLSGALLIALLSVTGDLSTLNTFDFLPWDAAHFNHIVREGYDQTRSAFFPGFPLIWKWTGLPASGISALNAILILLVSPVLAERLKLGTRDYLLMLATPSLLFIALPYAEAILFVCFASFVIAALQQKWIWALLALLTASLCKPNAAVFLPVIMGCAIWWTQGTRRELMVFGGMALAVIAGTFSALYIQSLETGELFGFFKSQYEWGNRLRWPSFPLGSWGELSSKLLDAVALWICLVAGVYLIWQLRLPRTERQLYLVNAIAAGYLAFTGLYVLFFRGGELFSLNRFVFCTPFFWVFYASIITQKLPHRTIVFIITWLTVAVSFGAYVHIQHALKFVVLGAALWGADRLIRKDSLNPAGRWMPYFLVLIIQVFFVWKIMHGFWVA